jgi:hypothetical protein
MATLEGWQIFLIVLAGVFALLFIAYQCILCWATHAYAKMVQDNTISVNDFVNEHPTPSQCLKYILLNRFNVGNKIPSSEMLELRVEGSDKVDGLQVTFHSDDLPNRNLLPKTWVPRNHHWWWVPFAWALDIIGLPMLPPVGE